MCALCVCVCVCVQALEEAELQLQSAHSELECLEAGPTRKSQQTPHREPAPSADEDQEEEEDKRLFHIERGTRMATILHEALDKRNQVISLQTDRIQVANARSQAMEDLKEQLELKRLYMSCDQDLEFAARLVKQSQVSNEVLLETLRLLLPTLPESELLSLTDALCPKHPVPPGSAEQESPVCPRGAGKYLLLRLRKEMVGRNILSLTTEPVPEQFQGKRQSLIERLFISPRLEVPREIMPVLVQEKEKQEVNSLAPQQPTPKPVATGTSRTTALEKLQDSVQLLEGGEVWEDSETVFDSTAAASLGFTNDAVVLDIHSTGERLSVIRALPVPQSPAGATHRKKKRNFLNWKKGSVSPMDHP
ncbi:hypothetical protein UPYG_G00161470 [Umbra pygmaea]|uniref:Uncharacterized protein n=1 Tax=Umbra pygmaea TaxID=75934 RepID=A0ABD0WLP7_UMBPY